MTARRSGIGGAGMALPEAGYVTLPGVGHTAAFTDEQPELVAVELRRFFG